AAVFQREQPYFSRGLLYTNLAFFIVGAVYAWSSNLNVADYLAGNSPAPDFTTNKVLLRLGALHVALVFEPDRIPKREADYGPRPQFERIILFFFLHIGLMHLAMNMYFLYSIGPLIESMWGSWRFFAIYFISGIVSGCVVLQFQLFEESGGL